MCTVFQRDTLQFHFLHLTAFQMCSACVVTL